MVGISEATYAFINVRSLTTETETKKIERDARKNNQAAEPLATNAKINMILWSATDDESGPHERKTTNNHNPAVNLASGTSRQVT